MMGTPHRRDAPKKSNDSARLVITTIMGVVFGFFIGVSFPSVSVSKALQRLFRVNTNTFAVSRPMDPNSSADIKVYVPTNPRGAELLPPGIIVSESDLYFRRLWGDPNEDLPTKPRYLVTFTVGIGQTKNIDAAFSSNFTILLFHYDGKTSEWDQFEWSKRAIHVSIRKQTKWYSNINLSYLLLLLLYLLFFQLDVIRISILLLVYVGCGMQKRFLHPDIVSSYEYIFIWDEDLGVEHFNAERYIELVKKHDLAISQRETEEKPGWCSDPHLPPCAAFVEIMAPVFSRDAWRCVWHMIQNDLVHGWGLDFALRRCVEPAHEKIGVVDSQWIIHQVIPSLGSQGESEKGKAPWEGVRERCRSEWAEFQHRLSRADQDYLTQKGKVG
ncbi:hypothetical protein MKW92_008761 [Papaver armeniacum]|nr:hypothetical protein MKW92_008761 [Papaver armeniacum]